MPAGSEKEIFEYDIWLPENLARMPLRAENMNPGR
jgi:hypothetical protein